MTLNDAMHLECKSCGDQAQYHRLTNSGQFYCLQANRYYDQPIGKSLKTWASTVKVGKLRKSPLPKRVGEYINSVLHNLDAQEAQLTL